MIAIEKERIPKEYERVVLEEYYNFFEDMYGHQRPLFHNKPTFTTDLTKLKKKDRRDPLLMASIGALESVNNPDIEYVTYKEDDGRISAVARIRVSENDLHIAEVLFLEYQSTEEKEKIVKEIINILAAYALVQEKSELYFEVPKTDVLGVDLALGNGFRFVDEPNSITSIKRTYVFQKDLTLNRNKENEWTRRRQQREE